ncbi:DHA2 family efflux MFS transporter permease subunit [Modestobacter sp. I12A-02628]|uniref:MFS transporter n=1 Tax=Goekera deserti TaxID=2497753 RepID=A0A7K3W9C3_9ACTN|nr:MDR family MFS transporter [Goekera deserti]MPQ98637.1 DHA2 family efflux MFS transporter permease subunit [Goekera deserti]NDI49199.1 DHA2 family efflux MFS transporter permease subunit [Goekera deserti]NEL52937.1 MFS transporter [Goekera deserti]
MTQTTDRAGAAEARAAAAVPDETGQFSHRQIMTILVGLLLGMFLAALDQTVVSTAIRTIADDLQGYDLQAWATTAFLITSTISTPLYGKLSDMYGRRPFFLFAISVFVLGSLLCGISTSMYELAGWRALQGIGAGGLMSLALTIIADIVPPRQRAKYQGYFMAVFGTSSVLGPVIGGFLAGQDQILGLDGWRWIFWVNVPLGALALFVVARNLHLPHRRNDHKIDWPGALGLIVFLVPLLIVAEQGRTWGWTDPKSLVCYVVGAVGFAWFFLAERSYGDDALLPIRMFRNRTFTVSALSSIVLGAGMFGGILLLPQYLQIVHGSSPTVAGLQMIPLVGGIMLGSITAGQTISRTGKYKYFPLVGVALMVISLVSLSQIIDADTSVWALAPLMVMLGVGLGFNFQPIILAVQNAVRPTEIGVATSSVTFFRQMGGTLGTAAFLSVLFSALSDKVPAAYAAAQGTPAFQQALAANPDQARELQNATAGGGDLSDTSLFQRIDAVLAAPFKDSFSSSIDLVMLIAAGVVALGFIVLVFLPQLALRTTSGIQGQVAPDGESAEAAGAAAPTSVVTPTAGAATADAGPDRDLPRAGRHEATDEHPTGRHEAVSEDQPTGLQSLPADHLPQGAGRPRD